MTTATKRLRRAGTAGLAALVAVSGAALVTAGTAGATSTATSTRIAGTDRYDTAAQLAAKAFPAGSTNVVLASGAAAHFPDALAGNYLAGQLNAPVLLTSSVGAMPAKTTAAIASLAATTVYILGDINAVPAAQEAALVALGKTVVRLGGTDRYQTGKLVAERSGLTAAGSLNGKKTAILVSGANFPDALSAGSLAFADKFPVVITTPAALHGAASATLTDLGIGQVIIAGNTSAVSAAAEASVNALGITTLFRASGTDRSNTSKLLADWEIANAGFSKTNFTVASGDQTLGGADALAGGPFAGGTKSPILVTNTINVAGAVTAFAAEMAPTVTSLNILGGTPSVSAAVATAILTAAQTGSSTNAITVTPTAASVANVTGTATDSDKVFTASGLDSTKTYTISFLPAANVTTSSGTTLFADLNSDNIADGLHTGGAAKITVVNGSAAASPTLDTATPVGGSITFTVEGLLTSGSVVPIVFIDANSNSQLDLVAPSTANALPKAASEVFGLGGKITYVPPAGTLGTHAAAVTTAVDTTAKYYVAAGAAFTWDSNDVFKFSGVVITQAQFEAMLNVGDSVDSIYAPTASSVSTFNIATDIAVAPAAPTVAVVNLDAGSTLNDVQVTFTPAATSSSGTTYLLLDAGVVVTGTSQTAGSTAGTQVITALNVANGAHTYAIRATSPSPSTATADSGTTAATTPGAPDTTAPQTIAATGTVLTTNVGLAGTLDAGDVITFTFNEAIQAPATGSIIQLSDTDATPTVAQLISGTNATFALDSTQKILTVTVTATPSGAQILNAGTTAGLGYPVHVSDSSGIKDLAGNLWSLAGGDITAP